MKSYNGLYRRLLSDTNIRASIIAAGTNKYKRNVRHKQLKFFKQTADDHIKNVRYLIENYQPVRHTPVKIYDGIGAKEREIIVPTVQEELVHHAIVNVFKGLAMKGMYAHTYASIPGRGVHSASKVIKRWLINDPTNTQYCLKLDIKKFFNSVDQDVLIAKLTRKIRDKRFLELLTKVIHSVPSGIPLGFVTSQWFANFLLTDLDHKIKEKWHARYYVRFMDDMVIFGADKAELHYIRTQVEQYLNTDLHLELKPNWQVFPIQSCRGERRGRFLDFLGFKFYRLHTGLRRKVALKMQRKAQHIHKKDRASIRDARQMVTYGSYIKSVNCHDWFMRHIALYVSIRGLIKKISRYDRLPEGTKFKPISPTLQFRDFVLLARA